MAILLAIAITPIASATSRIYPKLDQYVAASDVIAIVTVKKTNKESIINRTETQPYGYRTTALVQKTFKGDVSGSLSISHMSTLDDALFQQGPGDYLVFLKRQDDHYVPADGWPSSKPIKDGFVIGWSDSQSWSVKHALQEVEEWLRQETRKEAVAK